MRKCFSKSGRCSHQSLVKGAATQNLSPYFSSFVQPKLSVSRPDDVYEQEADAIADNVMRMQEGQNTFFRTTPSLVQRKEPNAEDEKRLQMKGKDISDQEMTHPSIVDEAISSRGQPLDVETKNFMESRFGHDFSDVRIHNDSRSHRSSSAINALAY